MELAILVYAISFLESLLNFCAAIWAAAFLVMLASGITILEGYRDTSMPIKWFKRGAIALVAASFIGALIPSERTSYMMVAAYATQKVGENPQTRETGEKVLQLINAKLDELILEAREPKKGKK